MVAPFLWRYIMKLYKINGITRWYEEGDAPKGAEVANKAEEPKAEVETKAVEPLNKAVEPKNKAVRGSKKK